MTRKHFKHLARVLKNMKPREEYSYTNEDYYIYLGELDLWNNTCNQMADFCSNYNSNFDRYRFLTACGVDDG
jgi:hypothetical protein